MSKRDEALQLDPVLWGSDDRISRNFPILVRSEVMSNIETVKKLLLSDLIPTLKIVTIHDII